jgi:glycosyltransferase involved in cell wall biosynthesis
MSKPLQISLLTAGKDRPYALGLGEALAEAEVKLDFIGSDEVSSPALQTHPRVNFMNLRGEQSTDAKFTKKMTRVLAYYFKLLSYAAEAKPPLFHVLWNNRFEYFDRTALILFYKLLGKKIVFTAHNVNIGKRDGHDTPLNRLTLKIQYSLCDHIFVHTKKMREELIADFSMPESKTSVIPLGINNSVPNTALTTEQARAQLGIQPGEKAMLFFGQIAPYKGLEYLVDAFLELARKDASYRLIIVGRPKGEKEYWDGLQKKIAGSGFRERVIQKIEFVPDAATELYFKAADVLMLPYNHIFQSGVLFLGYSFGLPVIASDVGSFREEIILGQTGYIFAPRDTKGLIRNIEEFFGSELYKNLAVHRPEIQAFANDRYSWNKVTTITKAVYHRLLEAA